MVIFNEETSIFYVCIYVSHMLIFAAFSEMMKPKSLSLNSLLKSENKLKGGGNHLGCQIMF